MCGVTIVLAAEHRALKFFLPYDGVAKTYESFNGRKAENLDELKAWMQEKRLYLIRAAYRHFDGVETCAEYFVEGCLGTELPTDSLEHVKAQAGFAALMAPVDHEKVFGMVGEVGEKDSEPVNELRRLH